MKNQNQDVVGQKCVKNDAGDLAFDNKSKLAAWKNHYETLLNVEWDSNSLSDEPPTEGPAIIITTKMITDALSKIKKGKLPGHQT